MTNDTKKNVNFLQIIKSQQMKTKIILLILGAIALLSSCQQTTSDASKNKKGMIKVTILYPNGDGKTFDMNYYSNKHMPMVAGLLGDSLKLLAIDRGIAGRTPEEPIPYLAIGYLYFDKLSAYQNSFGPIAEKIISDIPNYTNVQQLFKLVRYSNNPIKVSRAETN